MLKQTNFISNSFKFITMIMLITWLIMPLIPLVFFSFSKGWVFPLLLPKYWSLNAWNYALSDTAGILESLWLTIFISLSVTILSILIGVPAGRALGIYKFKILNKLTKKKVVALGGISKSNIKKVSLLDCYGLAGISYFQ